MIGVDVIVREDLWYDRMVEIGDIDRELSGADVVILTVPLTEETRELINEKRLNFIGEHGILVNIARGGIIDQKALEEWNGYAVLDVFEENLHFIHIEKASLIYVFGGTILAVTLSVLITMLLRKLPVLRHVVP